MNKNAPHHLGFIGTRLILGFTYSNPGNPDESWTLADYDNFKDRDGNTVPVDSTSFRDCPRTDTAYVGGDGDFVVVNQKSGMIHRSKSGKSYFRNEGSAKSEITRSGLRDTHEVLNISYYMEPMVKRINAITRQPFWEGINTPKSCSPSTESYHCM